MGFQPQPSHVAVPSRPRRPDPVSFCEYAPCPGGESL